MPGWGQGTEGDLGVDKPQVTVDTNVCVASVEEKYGTTEDGKQRWRMILSAMDSTSLPTDGTGIYNPASRNMLPDVAVAHLSVCLCFDTGKTMYYIEPDKEWLELPSGT